MPPQLLKTLTTRHGQMLAFPGDPFVTRCLEIYGEFSQAEWTLLEQLIKPGMVVVEVGANIGAHTVAMAKACRPGVLYAFEPQRRVFQVLCANLALNDVDNVIARPEACGAEPGFAVVPPMDYASESNFGGVSLEPAGQPGETVRVMPLDELGLTRCNLIKADVEGFELQVLAGAAETIARCRPLLYVENDRAEHRRALIAKVHEMGYRMFWHTPPLAGPGNFNGVERLAFERNYISLNMLCLPRELSANVEMETVDPDDPHLPKAFDHAPVGAQV